MVVERLNPPIPFFDWPGIVFRWVVEGLNQAARGLCILERSQSAIQLGLRRMFWCSRAGLEKNPAVRPLHVSRVWIKRDSKWVMAISYQATIQSAPAQAD
jgi:hypothetical protein